MSLWGPSEADPSLVSSSSRWNEAEVRQASETIRVAYAGAAVTIKPGERYFVDSDGGVLVGWHGTYNPPRDMGCYSLVKGVEE